MSEKRTDCLEYDGTFHQDEKPIIRYPFAWLDRAKWGLEGYYLFVNVFSYEGTVKDHTCDGRGYPWIEINIVLEDDKAISERKQYGFDSTTPIILHGQEWKIEDKWGYYSKTALSTFKKYREILEPGKFYCLDTGKILDLSKLKKPSA